MIPAQTDRPLCNFTLVCRHVSRGTSLKSSGASAWSIIGTSGFAVCPEFYGAPGGAHVRRTLAVLRRARTRLTTVVATPFVSPKASGPLFLKEAVLQLRVPPRLSRDLRIIDVILLGHSCLWKRDSIKRATCAKNGNTPERNAEYRPQSMSPTTRHRASLVSRTHLWNRTSVPQCPPRCAIPCTKSTTVGNMMRSFRTPAFLCVQDEAPLCFDAFHLDRRAEFGAHKQKPSVVQRETLGLTGSSASTCVSQFCRTRIHESLIPSVSTAAVGSKSVHQRLPQASPGTREVFRFGPAISREVIAVPSEDTP